MRIWIEFTKESPMRFLSHLDLMRAWQRALRRAKLPVAYSAGFNPHPKMSFASALAVGVTSEAEYLDMDFTQDLKQEDFDRLASALPQGLRIRLIRAVPVAAPSLMAMIGAAQWLVPVTDEEIAAVKARIGDLLQKESLIITRQGKKGKKTVDLRPLIYDLTVDEEQNRLVMLLATGGDGGAKPRELLGLLELSAMENRLHRKALYIHQDSCLQSPMSVLLNEKEVSINAKEDCYKL
jgi:radical SAM-linked protein